MPRSAAHCATASALTARICDLKPDRNIRDGLCGSLLRLAQIGDAAAIGAAADIEELRLGVVHAL